MRKFLSRFFGRLSKSLEGEAIKIDQPQEIINITHPEVSVAFLPKVEDVREEKKPKNDKTIEKKSKKKPSQDVIGFDPRDMMELMEVGAADKAII